MLWQGGSEAGIYAVGEVTGPVFQRPIAEWHAKDMGDADSEPAVPFRYTGILRKPIRKQVLLDDETLKNMTIIKRPVGTIFRVKSHEWAVLEQLLGEAQGRISIEELEQFTNTSRAELEDLEAILRDRKQIIFQGPPGSGKTFVADAFGRYISGNPLQGDRNHRMVLVQFHQSYGYEDFIQGIRPETDAAGQLSYVLRNGIFRILCDVARNTPGEDFVMVIDEINRGNIARIFGELLLLLEYRTEKVRLPYAREEDPPFSIPENVYLIGTMNTADRSLAQIDYALRRRFYFFEFTPVREGRAPYLERWLAQQDHLSQATKAELLALFLTLNSHIRTDMGQDFLIGHSFFMNKDIATVAGRERIWRHAILPLLDEYFHNRQDRPELLSKYSYSSISKAHARPQIEADTP